jgi:eukaryotic-like serine/threonine-protein kinase
MRSKVGHYDIVQELGRGGMGVVYKGFEASLNRHVAIKLMSESLAHDQQVVERFLREARSMAQLNDPHIIQIYMIGEDQGQPFFAMEFVEGESLSQTLRREGKIESKRAAGIIAQAAQGLSVAHDRGVVHRDIKPANLMLTPRGLVKVADFGIALANHDFEKKLTGTGEFVGTPGYLSPEVCLGKLVDQRSDVFSLGIVLFEMLAGRMPFTDQSPLGLMLEVVQADIPDVRSLGADAPQPLVAVLNKMLAKDPDQRYLSCHDLLSDLAKTGAIASTVNVATPAPGITSASTLPQGARQAAPNTAPRAPLPNLAAPPMPPPSAHQQQAYAQAPPANNVHQMPAPNMAMAPAYSAPPAKKSSGPMWAIAASVLIATGVGGYAMRDKIFASGTAGVVQAPSVPVIEKSALGDTAVQETKTPDAATPDPTAPNPTTPDVQAPVSEGTVADSQAPPTPTQSANPATAVELAAAQAELERMKQENARLAAENAASDAADAQPRAPLAGLRNRIEAANNKRDLNPRIASNTPTPRLAEPAAPLKTGVVVIPIGDMGAAGAAEAAIEDALNSNGYTVIDEDAFPGLAAMRGRGTIPAILAAAKRAGISAAVVVRVTKTGSQALEFYGQHDTRTLASMEVKAYTVSTGASLNSFREDIGYTGLNAAENGRNGVETHLRALISKLGAHRSRG